jgi:hypothetical protein
VTVSWTDVSSPSFSYQYISVINFNSTFCINRDATGQRPRFEARQLHAVLAVAEYNSFIAAAAFLKTSQPALTRTIKRVEDVLGVRLFNRSTRRVVITAAGKEFVAVADASYALEVNKRHPHRFALVQPVDPANPSIAEVIADWKRTPGAVGVRMLLVRGKRLTMVDPRSGWLRRGLIQPSKLRQPIKRKLSTDRSLSATALALFFLSRTEARLSLNGRMGRR